ncbi:CBS domain-containing protein [Methanomassiliicoccaceae archaeon COG_1]|nr:CBS domain-containing protein [Methanomassiliicoccaceae archaeon COG_1]
MNQLRVRDLMTTQVITVRPTDTVKQAVIKMAIDNIAAVPVTDNRSHVVGLLSQTDVLALILKYQNMLDKAPEHGHLLSMPMDDKAPNAEVDQYNREISGTKVEEIMTHTIITTTPDAEIVEALRAMLDANINRLPVLEKGVLIGTISRADILFYIYKRKV